MIELKNLVVDMQPPLPDRAAVVHPFYKASFLRLSGLAEEAVVPLAAATPRANEEFLIPLLRFASRGYTEEIRHFYDVRTTEEYGQTAPEYVLLAGAGLRQVSPLSVKGRGALFFALKLAEEQLRHGEAALFCCAELYTPLDGRYGKQREACAFLLRKCGSEDALEGGTVLLEYNCNVSKEEALTAARRSGAALVCSDDRAFCPRAGGRYVETEGLVQPFAELLRARENTDMLILSHDDGRYGYLHIRKGGKTK